MNRERMEKYLEEQINACRRSAATLAADHRADEAVFDKVRLNVYDIFRSVLNAAVKSSGQAVPGFFLRRLDQITGAWQTSREQAERHGDGQKAHIEAVKLDAASKVREHFVKIWEVEG